jgi:hypothetical protein
MAKDEQKPPTTQETPALTAPGLTRDDLLAVVRELVAGNRLDASAIAEVATKAGADVFEKLSGQWWDIGKYPGISAFNPLGEKNHPRPELVGKVFWLGYLLNKNELTKAEIDYVNQLQPGLYHDGHWTVMNLRPGVSNTQELLVLFPCKDPDARANLPRSMTEMLREMVEGVPALI